MRARVVRTRHRRPALPGQMRPRYFRMPRPCNDNLPPMGHRAGTLARWSLWTVLAGLLIYVVLA